MIVRIKVRRSWMQRLCKVYHLHHEASHIDDLTDLENDNKDYDMHNLTPIATMWSSVKKQMVETTGTKIVDRNQTDSDDSTDETAGLSVFFGKIRIAGT